jgi:oxygen-independent coproporphyrinogen-3 oxidase
MWIRNKALLHGNGCEITKLKTLYIGGGTPSLWGERGASFLKDLFNAEGVELAKDCEFTLEVNPGTWTSESIRAWKAIGVSRFSLGIQSLRSDYLKILDRVHSVEDVFETLEYFNSIEAAFSVDFMLGLPWSESKERHIENELNEILKFKPEHLSLYILTAKGGYPHKKELPEDDFLEKEYLKVAELLKARGFDHYEVSNFALKGKESRHNLQYWRGGSVAAVGPSGVGFLSEEALRYKWKTSDAVPVLENLNQDEVALEKLYLGLRIHDGIFLKDHFNTHQLAKLVPLFKSWDNEGLALYHDDLGSLVLTSRGYLVLDGLINQIFTRL